MDSGSDAGASLWSLQPVARPAECALETCGKAEGMESRQIPTHAGLGAVFDGSV